MALTNCILGTFLELCSNKNIDLAFGIDNVRGVNNQKQMMSTKADLNNRDLSKFQIVYPGDFVFNHRTSRNGSKFSIAYNDGEQPVICTEDYVVFRVRDNCKNILNPRWLYMFFNRPEFDRFVITNSWGSSTEFYNWEDIQTIQLTLPDIEIQNKYVDVYNAMLANQQSYERGLDDLKLTCDAYIEELRRKTPCQAIGPYIQPCDERNSDLSITLAQGITNNKEFAYPKQIAESERNAKIVRTNQFAYNRATTRNGDKISIAYRDKADCVVSAAYQVFEITKPNVLLPEYLMMWFRRSEFDRYSRYMSKGSAHEFFEYSDMEDVIIPIPSITVQKCIIDIYNVWKERRSINEKLKSQIKNIYPILIKGSLEKSEAKQ